MARIHDAAATGYSRQSDAYVSGRPSYHPLIIDYILQTCGEDDWLELGAGTGIATRLFVERGVDIIATEPVDEMRATLAASLPNVDVRPGRADDIPVDDGTVRSVLAAQCFHWFDYAAALDEIARVLTRGGRLVTLWNVRDESVDWMAEWTRLQNPHSGDTPRYYTMNWRRAIEQDDRFRLLGQTHRPNPWPTTADGVVARMRSTSFIASLDDNTRADLEAELRALVEPLGAEFDMPYRCEAQIWTLQV